MSGLDLSPYTQPARPSGHLSYNKYAEISGATKGFHPPSSHQKNDPLEYTAHKQLVNNAKSMIDNKTPRSHPRVPNMNRLTQERDRTAEMEKENMLLLEKIGKVLRDGGDTRTLFDSKPGKSLNNEKRRKELVKIMYENINLLKRLMMRGTNYPKHEQIKKWEAHEDMIHQVSRFPVTNRPESGKSHSERVDASNKIIKSKIKSDGASGHSVSFNQPTSCTEQIHRMDTDEEFMSDLPPVESD